MQFKLNLTRFPVSRVVSTIDSSVLTNTLSVLQDVGISHSDDSDGSEDSDSDNFSVEFEVESIDSDDYSEKDGDSVPGDDEV